MLKGFFVIYYIKITSWYWVFNCHVVPQDSCRHWNSGDPTFG